MKFRTSKYCFFYKKFFEIPHRKYCTKNDYKYLKNTHPEETFWQTCSILLKKFFLHFSILLITFNLKNILINFIDSWLYRNKMALFKSIFINFFFLNFFRYNNLLPLLLFLFISMEITGELNLSFDHVGSLLKHAIC